MNVQPLKPSFPAERVPALSVAKIPIFHNPGFEFVDLEIGCGVGWHPIQYAQKNPNRCLIALEHGRDRFQSFSRRLARHAELKNLQAWQADAIPYLTHRMPSQSLDRVMIYYPNPYPKNSQANKRFHRMPFFEILQDRMKSGATLEIRSNEAAYIADAKDWLLNRWGMTLQSHSRISKLTDFNFSAVTHFEQKYFQRGELLDFIVFNKA